VEISSVEAILDLVSKIKSIPDQSLDNSVDLQTGHILPVVNALHFLHANSFTNSILIKIAIFISYLF